MKFFPLFFFLNFTKEMFLFSVTLNWIFSLTIRSLFLTGTLGFIFIVY